MVNLSISMSNLQKLETEDKVEMTIGKTEEKVEMANGETEGKVEMTNGKAEGKMSLVEAKRRFLEICGQLTTEGERRELHAWLSEVGLGG